ncbi:calcium homeostasis modulator protein 5-like isoform X1 [Acropora muricata]|uniref:calcium homeostasis modulator protein 5-like isoform X1 n=2 Tax=Acropora muricata TaxID=159855 RepID=UPI0034E4F2A9
MKNVLDAIEQHWKQSKGTIQNIIILLAIYGFEEFIRRQLFRCPCSNFFMYSMLMMGGPALFLLSLGFMLSEGFWKSLLEISTLQDWKQRCNHRMKSLSRLFQPLLAPTAYITLVLFRGEFFTCSRAGGSDTVCKRRVSDEYLLPQDFTEHNILTMHTQSQMLGFGVLVAATLFTVGLACIRRSCFEDDGLPNVNDLKELEKKIAEELFLEKLQEVIIEDVKKKIAHVFQFKAPSDVKEALHKAREVLARKSHHDKRMARYIPLGHEDDENELRLMDSTHL